MLCFVYLLYAAVKQTNLKLTSLTYDHFTIAHGSMKAWQDDSSAPCGVGGSHPRVFIWHLNFAEKSKVAILTCLAFWQN